MERMILGINWLKIKDILNHIFSKIEDILDEKTPKPDIIMLK